MSEPTRSDDAAVAAEVDTVRAEYADEEAETAEREAAENASALDLSPSVRINQHLDPEQMRRPG